MYKLLAAIFYTRSQVNRINFPLFPVKCPPGTAARCNLHDQKCPVSLDGWRRLCHHGAVAKLEIQILCPR